MTTAIDWRLPEHRREAFQRFYSFHLKHRAHPGMVYSWLPALADYFDANDDPDALAWIVWLNGNTQNPVMTSLLLEAAPHPRRWKAALDVWDNNYVDMEWDTDRRHQKPRFAVATEHWVTMWSSPADGWARAAEGGWPAVWKHALSHPHMGRLSAWSMTEYARILLPGIPDADNLMLTDASGSRSHRNGLAVVAGYNAENWPAEEVTRRDLVPTITALGADLLAEARVRNPGNPDVGYLTLESALCTYKSWHKPNRRYAGVYADMAHRRLLRAEARFGRRFEHLWAARATSLPEYLRIETNSFDPGLSPFKQNHYRETGQVPVLGHEWPDMWSDFDTNVAMGVYPPRDDRKVR